MLSVAQLLLFVFVCYGITNIVVGSKLFEPVRYAITAEFPKLGSLIECYMCTAFWVGVLVSLAGFGPTQHTAPDDWRQYFSYVFDASIASGTTWVIYVVLQQLGEEDL